MTYRKIARLEDIENGVQQVLVVVPSYPRRREKFVMTAQGGLQGLYKDKDLNGQDWRVLLAFVAEADFDNWVNLTQAEIAELLEIAPQHVSKSVKKLLEKGYLFKEARHGRRKLIRLNAVFFWKGRPNKTFTETFESHSSQLRLIS